MPPDLARSAAASVPQRIPQAWRTPLVRLALVWLGLIALFWPQWRAMAGQWWDSSTYNHILLVPPILAWLVAQREREVLALAPRGWWPALVPFAGAALLWVLGDFAGLSIAQQLGAVVMLQMAVPALLGPRVAAALLFPLFYMIFLVPFGDELVPALQTVTARITMVLLGLSGISAVLDGVFITTRFGYFEVAEACSGVKFLIAMTAYGALVSNVCFRSWTRRAAFMAVSVVLPILANGVRAWGTIWIASWRGIEFAASFDHVFYGWVFFAVVLALAMGAGWRFFDRATDAPMVDLAGIEASALLARWERAGARPAAVATGLVVTVALALGWAGAAHRLAAPLPDRLTPPAAAGWQLVEGGPATPWRPHHGGADRRLLLRYRDAQGHAVDLSYALYARQEDGREAGGFGQGALPLESAWSWEQPGPAFDGARSDVIQAPGPLHRLAVTWYRTGALLTGSNARLKLANIADRLALQARPTAVLIISAEDGQGMPAEALVRAFIAAAGPPDAVMDRLAATR